MKEKKNSSEGIIITLIVSLMISSFFIFDMSEASSSSIMIVLSIMVIILLIHNHGIIPLRISSFHIRVFIFAVICILSAVWAWIPSEAISRGLTILEILLCMSVLFMFYQDSYSVDGILKAIMISGVIVSLYTISYYGFEAFRMFTIQSERLGNDFASINAIGMWMAICTTIFAYYIINQKWNWFYLFSIFPVLILALSQSRTALIEVVVGIGFTLLFRYSKKGSAVSRVLKVLIAVILFYFLLKFLSTLPVFSGLVGRVFELINGTGKVGGSIDQRNSYIQAGFAQFLNNPILGIGFGSTYKIAQNATGHYTYLHNNYIEVLASGGIVGFVAYYTIHFNLLKSLIYQWKNRIMYSDICLTVLLITLIADYGTVTYYKKSTYVVLALCFLQLELAKHKKEENAYYGEKEDLNY